MKHKDLAGPKVLNKMGLGGLCRQKVSRYSEVGVPSSPVSSAWAS